MLAKKRTTMLETAAAQAASPSPAETMLSRARQSQPRGEYVTLPMVGRVWIELPGTEPLDEIEGAVYAAMAGHGIPLTVTGSPSFDNRLTALTLAWAARNPEDHEQRVGTRDQWLTLVDVDALKACGIIYNDVRERLAPLSAPLTDEEFEAIRLAHEKKSPTLLTFGVVSLWNYLARTDAPPSSSPTMSSSSGPS